MDVLINQPLRSMFANGPRSLGMWSGASNVTICATLTSPVVSSEFWARPEAADECAALVERTVDAWVVFARMVIYFYILTQLIQHGVLGLLRTLGENVAAVIRGALWDSSPSSARESKPDSRTLVPS
jgi:hypothetical protein